MLFKVLSQIPAFTASDDTLIREWLHPKNDGVDLPYSLALAELEPGAASLPHILQRSAEIYILLEGEGTAHVSGQAQRLQAGELLLIPVGAEQWIENTGTTILKFLCIVSPPWSEEDDLASSI